MESFQFSFEQLQTSLKRFQKDLSYDNLSRWALCYAIFRLVRFSNWFNLGTLPQVYIHSLFNTRSNWLPFLAYQVPFPLVEYWIMFVLVIILMFSFRCNRLSSSFSIHFNISSTNRKYLKYGAIYIVIFEKYRRVAY